MKLIFSLILLSASAFAANPACLEMHHHKKTEIEWPDEAQHPDGFYWVDFANRCGRDLGRLYVVVAFWDAQHRHITDSFWAFDFEKGKKSSNRFSAPKMDRSYQSISVVKITKDIMDAVCMTDPSRCRHK
jgi:hypothetical protein